MAIAGRVAIVPKGDWSADATYKRLDAVTYNNTLYFAKKDVPAGTETSNTEYWSKSIVGGAGAIATTEEAGIVKPDGKSMSVDESGTLSINLDGTTITLDEAKNVIKLADTLKDAINGAFPAANVANNQITTEEGFALDARQANPNLDGTLAKQLSDLNGSLNNLVPVIDNCDLVTTHLAISENALNSPYLSGVVHGSYALILTVAVPTPQLFNQQIAFVSGGDEIALRGCGGDGKWGAWKKINVN